MPTTTSAVAMRWTIMERASSFSRPKMGRMRVRTRPMKKITMGSVASATTEASATAGAETRARR